MKKFITSLGPEGFELYGKEFLQTWVEYWPYDITVYYEQEEPDFKHEKVHYKNLFDVDGAVDFLRRANSFPVMSGMVNGKRNYRYDVFRFARKSFAQIDAASDYDGQLFWIDADVVTHSQPPSGWLDTALENTFMCYLGRPEWHSCASFVGWDCSHERSFEFWANYLDLLVSGKFLLLPEWHDSYFNDFLRVNLALPARNLVEGIEGLNGPANVFDKVLTWAHHKKGNLKYKHTGPQRYGQIIDIIKQVNPSTILEVGTWNGGRAVEMTKSIGDPFYYGFDLFEDATSETDEVEKNVKPHHTIESVGKMLNKYGVRHELYKGNTNETLKRFADNNSELIDFAYIDGGHAVETIRNDWENVKKVMKPGGVVLFDDYYTDMPEEDLEKWGANKVLEEIGDYELLPIADPVAGGGKTLIAKVVIPC